MAWCGIRSWVVGLLAMVFPFGIRWWNQYTGRSPWVQTVVWNTTHAPEECEPGSGPWRAAAAGLAPKLRGRGAPPELHARRRRALSHAVRGQPADPAGGSGTRRPLV